ncbi:MAG: MarR family transcriptional regulator [Candidatus Saccharimonadales bacterium]
MKKDELFERLYDSLNATKRIMHGRTHALAGNCPINRTQMELMFTLKHLQPTSAKRLATEMHLTPGAISQLIEGLVELKLVSRQTGLADRRTQSLKMSASGLQKMHEIEMRRHDLMKHVMQGMTIEELEVLLRVTEKLNDQFATINKITNK